MRRRNTHNRPSSHQFRFVSSLVGFTYQILTDYPTARFCVKMFGTFRNSLPAHSPLIGTLKLFKTAQFRRQIQFEKALQTANEALQSARATKDKRLTAALLNEIGNTSRDIYRQETDKYLPIFKEALEIAQSLKDSSLISDTYENLVYTYFMDNSMDIERALENLELALATFPNQTTLFARYRFTNTVVAFLSYLSGENGIRVVPLVYYKKAAAPKATLAKKIKKASSSANGISIKLISQLDGSLASGIEVIAFTDFANRIGDGGKTNKQGIVKLNLKPGDKIQRLYLYPEKKFWGVMKKNISSEKEMEIKVKPIDLSFEDSLRYFYKQKKLPKGKNTIRVGVLDTGAGPHPDLIIMVV